MSLPIETEDDEMRWSDERWVAFLRVDASPWIFFSFNSMIVFPLLLRRVDRSGRIDLGGRGESAVLRLLGVTENEHEVVREALFDLGKLGAISMDDNALTVTRFLDGRQLEPGTYVRLYTRDTPAWKRLPLVARGLFCLLLRSCDRAGLLELGSAGLPCLTDFFGGDAKVVMGALGALLVDGCIEHNTQEHCLVVCNFIEAQETRQSDAARMRASRERARDGARILTENAESTSHLVTRRYTPLQNVTLSDPSDLIRSNHPTPVVCEVDPVPDTSRTPLAETHPPLDLSEIDPQAGITREHIVALVARYPILGKLWPEHLEHLYVVASFEHCLRFGQVQQAFRDWFAKRAPSCSNLAPPALLGDLSSFVGQADMQRGGKRQAGPSSADMAAVFGAFDPVWCKRMKCERRPKDARDDWAAEHIAVEVKAHAKAIGAPRWGEVLKRVIAAYVELDDRGLDAKDYPLWELQNRLAAVLGQIKAKPAKPKAPAPRPPEPTREEIAAAAREWGPKAIAAAMGRPMAAPVTAPVAAASPCGPTQAPPSAPSAPADPSGSSRAQEGAVPCQQTPCEQDRAGPDPPVARASGLRLVHSVAELTAGIGAGGRRG